MKIAFLWNFDKANEIYDHWKDGLRAAIDVIGVNNDVDIYCGKYAYKLEGEYDFLLFWTDSRDSFLSFYNLPIRKGMVLTTDPVDFDNLRNMDVIYCESTPVYEAVRRQGLRTIKAFGTDTKFYTPDDTPKDIKYFYPATFSPWKLQRNIAYLGKDLTCVGTVQPDGEEDYAECVKNGVNIEVGYFPPEKIRDYYKRAQHVIIPAIHGSERTCLEAMSMNIVPEVNPQNRRTCSYVEEYRSSGLSPREFVLKNYSEEKYAQDLLRGMK